MKVIVCFFLAAATAHAQYSFRGWKPNGPQFNLPTRNQPNDFHAPLPSINDAEVVVPQSEYSSPGSGEYITPLTQPNAALSYGVPFRSKNFARGSPQSSTKQSGYVGPLSQPNDFYISPSQTNTINDAEAVVPQQENSSPGSGEYIAPLGQPNAALSYGVPFRSNNFPRGATQTPARLIGGYGAPPEQRYQSQTLGRRSQSFKPARYTQSELEP